MLDYRYTAHNAVPFLTEPTKITVPPLNMDATVGESIVLPCEVSKDPSLDPTFKWFFNGKLIDFNRQDHFEMIGGVRIRYGAYTLCAHMFNAPVNKCTQFRPNGVSVGDRLPLSLMPVHDAQNISPDSHVNREAHTYLITGFIS